MPRIKSVKSRIRVPIGPTVAAGAVILLAEISVWAWPVAFFPQLGWLIGSDFTAIMSVKALIGMLSGVIVMFAGIMMSKRPRSISIWGITVLVFSAVSLLASGGFLVGAGLGIFVGIAALAKRKELISTK